MVDVCRLDTNMLASVPGKKLAEIVYKLMLTNP